MGTGASVEGNGQTEGTQPEDYVYAKPECKNL
jgi:hypothetical protein